MCGVHLLVDSSVSDDAITNMVENCTHRGPDHSEVIQIKKGIFLASNRLKISDLRDEANQPIFNEERTAFLSWNGFLYNYQDLKNQLLEEGVVFKTRSDGEVLFHWLKQKGIEGISSIEGMFAVVFVDVQNSKIILARDPVGMKSLYFYQQKNKLLCSSEVNCLLKSGAVKKEFDAEQIVPFWYLRTSLPSASFYKEIKELLPGQVLQFGFDGQRKSTLKLPIQKRLAGKEVATDQSLFEQQLTEAVLTHFTAEVPVGMILSGGADSSLLYHIWYKETGVPLPSYTVGFERAKGKNSIDAKYAANLTKTMGGGNHEINIGPDYFLATWEEYISQLDQPVGDSAGYLTWAIAKEAKKEVKVLVSGVGADELFAGYNRHKAFKAYLKHPQLWQNISGFLKHFPQLSRSRQKFLKGIHPEPSRTFINFAALYPVPEELGIRLKERYPTSEGDFKNALAYDQSLYLVQDLLKIHDNACMANGIEGRAPFLDWSLIGLSDSMSNEFFMRTTAKSWIKDTLVKEGLESIAKREKRGFGLPILDWFNNHPEFRNKLSSSVIAFGEKYGNFVSNEWQPLLKHPEKHIQYHYLLLFNVFLLSEWINLNSQ
ncbi:asparagine synthase (glutamine-hydrolyzing) [Cyclobacterium sp. 1_MG-2023]|uniref:asparagine synthase (glutamine-hydrolyzing) n=1 Tax=Cyclobacterium sp. 1_MG-2023 TaxID=3062681 RepID=UPI0026E1D77B|nr:asparagine synthase (glutamine-hydrolyzing) [Cyclobacterium sp. 1_MG-2023]MDO6439644.1 asparagine synthase (glutamine-hydrolyzing) [Cyclobacterium sp. 1_MG-2023]